MASKIVGNAITVKIKKEKIRNYNKNEAKKIKNDNVAGCHREVFICYRNIGEMLNFVSFKYFSLFGCTNITFVDSICLLIDDKEKIFL